MVEVHQTQRDYWSYGVQMGSARKYTLMECHLCNQTGNNCLYGLNCNPLVISGDLCVRAVRLFRKCSFCHTNEVQLCLYNVKDSVKSFVKFFHVSSTTIVNAQTSCNYSHQAIPWHLVGRSKKFSMWNCPYIGIWNWIFVFFFLRASLVWGRIELFRN